MNAALYIRVSTEDQVELSPDSQKKLLLEYAKSNNLLVEDEHIFMDEGISGRKAEKRPEFMKMIGLAKSQNKPFEKILVWKFSRFARNQEESIVYKNMLRKDNIEVISISEPIIDGPFGALIERIIEWMDEYYSIRLSGEVMRGMKEKAMRGRVVSPPTYGYNVINSKYIINESEARIVRKSFDMLINGDTCGVIAKHLNSLGVKNKKGNLFTGRVIRYMIQNPVYYGMIRWNYATQQGTGRKVNPEEDWIIVKGEHNPIITEEIWKKANNLLKTTKPTSRPISTGYKHWLGGILRCKECGGTLTFGTTYTRRNGKEYKCEKYSCNNYIKGKCLSCSSISIKKIEKEVMTLLSETSYLLSTDGCFDQLNIRVEDNSNEQALFNKQLENLSKRLAKAKEAYLSGIDTLEEYKQNKSSIEADKNTILTKLNSIQNPQLESKELLDICKNAIQILHNPNSTIEDKNKALKKFIDSIVYDKKSATLDINLFYNSSSI